VVLATATTSAAQDSLISLGIDPLPPTDSQSSIQLDGQVQAATLIISTNGTLSINLPGQVEETGGDPEQLWDNPNTGATVGTYGAGGTTAGGVVAATNSPDPYTGATIGSMYATPAPTPGLYAAEIIINAATVNLNGLIQSGQANYTLTLDPAVDPYLNSDLSDLVGKVSKVTALAHQPSGDFVVYWDPIGNSGRLLVSPTRVNGGDVEITGNILNTGNGQIKVLGGYGNISVTNNTSYDLEVQKLDVSTPGAGTLLINDTSGIGQVTFDPNVLRNPSVANDTTQVVDVAGDTIAVAGNPGLTSGTAVVYDDEGHTPIGGLTNGQTYYVKVLGDGTFQLYTNAGLTNLVNLSGSVSAAMGPVQRFTYTPGNLASGRQAGHVYTTLYQASNGDVAVTTDDGVNPATTLDAQPLTESYSPMSTWRYGWTIGVTQQVKAWAIETHSSWAGLISTGSGYTGPFTNTVVEGVPTLVGAGPYYYTANDGLATNGYSFTSTTIPAGSTSFNSKPLDTTTTWYGTTTITVEHDAFYGQQILNSSEISAARPVDIQFIGGSQGTVTVNSKGNVYIDGAIMNPTGTTTITSQGSIESAGNSGVVGGNHVVLQAQNGIGDVGGPLQIDVAPTSISFDPGFAGIVNLSGNTIQTGPATGLKTGTELTYDAEGNSAIGGLISGHNYYANFSAKNGTIQLYGTRAQAFAGGAGGRVDLTSDSNTGAQQRFTITTSVAASLDATTASGDIDLAQVASGGNLSIDKVAAQSLGTVTLSSQGSILVAGGGQGLVSGGAINLSAAGAVGNGTNTPLLLDSPNATDVLQDKLTITAQTNVYLQEKSGDLRVNSIITGGDVWINVPNGNLLDENSNSHIDQRTEAELLSGVWNSLHLTDATGYHQEVQAAISAFVTAKAQEYQTYWQFRNEQPDPSVFDPNFLVVLTPAQL
ncbi:MAG: hypothetical protein ACRDT5_09015, partial [Mycobacterium sp.]